MNILYLLKLKNILNTFPKIKSELISFFYLCEKNEFKNKNLLTNFNAFSSTSDILVIGNTYKYFSEKIEKKSTQFISLNYYLKLLENQYLSSDKFFN
jgi:hypothetical protein